MWVVIELLEVRSCNRFFQKEKTIKIPFLGINNNIFTIKIISQGPQKQILVESVNIIFDHDLQKFGTSHGNNKYAPRNSIWR